jgi:hypothetical protein
MLKSLMLTVACAYINPPGVVPNVPVFQASVPEILKQAYAMVPGTQQVVIVDHGDDLCSKLVIEISTDEALSAFVDQDAWDRQDRPVGLPGNDSDYTKYQ